MNLSDEITIPLDGMSVICRLCLSVSEKLHNLFRPDETEPLGISLSMKVALCTATVIKKHDTLPQKICHKCFSYVNDWYLFRKRCKKVNLLLRENIDALACNEKSITSGDINSFEKNNDKSEENIFFSNHPGVEQSSELNFETFYEKDSKENEMKPVGEPKPISRRKKKFNCNLCPDSFYFFKDLDMHRILIHNYIKSNTSKISSVTDSDIKLDGINIRTRYEMKCCDKVFFSKIKFRKHYTEKHPGEKPFMCETCGKKDFISEETLKRHKILHTGKFRCDICFKTFTCNAILILHKRDKHENDKPFICDICGKRFVTELLMNYHKRFHTGEKKYVCEECGLAVVTSSSLAKHKRIHSKEKPYVCHVCGKGFIIKGRLVEHLRMHTGERPFGCHICHKNFTMRDKLKRHIRIHSGEKQFSCEYCGNNYSTRYGLSIHLKCHETNCS